MKFKYEQISPTCEKITLTRILAGKEYCIDHYFIYNPERNVLSYSTVKAECIRRLRKELICCIHDAIINGVRESIVKLLQNYYTRPKAYKLARQFGEEDYFILQCKRYSVDVAKLIGRVEAQDRQNDSVSKMTIEKVKNYSKFFS